VVVEKHSQRIVLDFYVNINSTDWI